jgi:hypothetical protein
MVERVWRQTLGTKHATLEVAMSELDDFLVLSPARSKQSRRWLTATPDHA